MAVGAAVAATRVGASVGSAVGASVACGVGVIGDLVGSRVGACGKLVAGSVAAAPGSGAAAHALSINANSRRAKTIVLTKYSLILVAYRATVNGAYFTILLISC
jgi:hypothetical protein